MIFFAIAIAYVLIGMLTARRQWAVMAYNRRVLELPMPMNAHTQSCGSREWQTSEYKRQYCHCGYYKSHDDAVSLPATIFFWPLDLADGFLKGGTYTPKEVKAKQLRSAEWEAMVEKELGIGS